MDTICNTTWTYLQEQDAAHLQGIQGPQKRKMSGWAETRCAYNGIHNNVLQKQSIYIGSPPPNLPHRHYHHGFVQNGAIRFWGQSMEGSNKFLFLWEYLVSRSSVSWLAAMNDVTRSSKSVVPKQKVLRIVEIPVLHRARQLPFVPLSCWTRFRWSGWILQCIQNLSCLIVPICLALDGVFLCVYVYLS